MGREAARIWEPRLLVTAGSVYPVVRAASGNLRGAVPFGKMTPSVSELPECPKRRTPRLKRLSADLYPVPLVLILCLQTV